MSLVMYKTLQTKPFFSGTTYKERQFTFEIYEANREHANLANVTLFWMI